MSGDKILHANIPALDVLRRHRHRRQPLTPLRCRLESSGYYESAKDKIERDHGTVIQDPGEEKERGTRVLVGDLEGDVYKRNLTLVGDEF